jgi:hypothetical protein
LKRAHHSGDVAQSRALQFAFPQSARRLALEIENDEIFPGGKHLAEMVVTVNPNFGRVRAAIEDELLLRENFLF